MTHVVPDDLRRDADRWEAVAAALQQTFARRDLSIPERDFSVFSSLVDLSPTYHRLAYDLTEILGPGGVDELRSMAAQLRRVADDYDAADEHQAERYEAERFRVGRPR